MGSRELTPLLLLFLHKKLQQKDLHIPVMALSSMSPVRSFPFLTRLRKTSVKTLKISHPPSGFSSCSLVHSVRMQGRNEPRSRWRKGVKNKNVYQKKKKNNKADVAARLRETTRNI